MDTVLGTARCPSLTDVVQWLANDDNNQPIVVVSNHEAMLEAILLAKLRGDEVRLFDRVLFVYLRKPKDRLARHLAKPNSAGHCRDRQGQRYTLTNYDRFDALFQELAGVTINCAAKGVAQVAAEIAELSESLNKRSL
jgi:hypothetical protein